MRYLFLLSLLLFAWPVASAQEMSFRLIEEDQSCRECRYVLADGLITSETPAKFEAFAKENRLFFEDVVVLRSTGGSLFGGLALGRSFRRAGLSTHVGSLDFSINGNQGVQRCISACAYAYLGGNKRSVGPDGEIGVHRFFTESESEAKTSAVVEAVQSMIADLNEYVDEMEVTSDFVAVATGIASDEVRWLTYATLLSMNAVNSASPYAKPKWETLEGGRPSIFSSATRANGSVERFMMECAIGFGARPVKLSFSKQGPEIPSSRSWKSFEVMGSMIATTLTVDLNGTQGVWPSSVQSYIKKTLDLSLRSQQFSVSGHVMAKDLHRLISNGSDITLKIIGDEEFKEVLGDVAASLPIENLPDLLRSELKNCEK
jgi:hypothetical protein